jgi:hypothetical protein
MNSTNWKDIAELIGIAAIVASLVFVGMQMRQTQDIALTQAGIDTMANMIERAALKVQHVDIWNKGSAGEKLDESEATIYWELMTLEDQSAFFRYGTWQRLGTIGDEVTAIDFAALLHKNPGARRQWEARMEDLKTYRMLLGSEALQDVAQGYGWEDEVERHLNSLDK